MQPLSKPQKILAVMLDLCKGDPMALQYEDIVVAAFKRYPEDFQLRGYPMYPDSSDVHKPLYEMKQQGLLRSANKTFELTARGLEVAAKLMHSESETKDRLTKLEESEINRIVKTASFTLFQDGRKDSILDSDFYEYLGVTVRTSRANCLGRLSNVEHAVAAYGMKRADNLSHVLQKLHEFLLLKFNGDIQQRK
jgi:hypothetical protein